MQQPTTSPLPPAAPVDPPANAPGQKSMNPAAIVAIVLLVGLAFYFMFTYSGPYQWIAELELRWMGSYHEELTLILTMFALILPAVGIAKLMRMAVKKLGPGIGTAPAAGNITNGASTPKPARKIPVEFVWPFMGLICIAIGGFMYWRGATAGPLTAVKLQDLEDGKKPASSYLTVEGVPIWQQGIQFGSYGASWYVPLVSKDWKGDAVAVYVEVRGDDVPPRSKQLEIKSFKGMKAVGGLPGPVRVVFEKSALKPAAGYLMLETKEEPAKLMGFGKWPMIVGAALVVGGLVWWGLKRIVIGR